MELNLVKETILRWLNSSETKEHIDLCYDAAQEFIVRRFKGKVSDNELDDVVKEVIDRMVEKETEIIMASGVWLDKPVGRKIATDQLN